MILIKVPYCVVWGCVDFKNIKRNKKGSPKFVVGIVALLRNKPYLVFLFMQALQSICSVP